MGELHLDIIIDRMRREYKVDCTAGKTPHLWSCVCIHLWMNVIFSLLAGEPQVAYRETITVPATIEYQHKKQSGGAGQYAKVKIEFYPLERDPENKGKESTVEFVNAIKGGAIPREYVPAVLKGIESVMQNGVLAGFPMLGMKAVLVDGAFHDVDSSALAFEIAGRQVSVCQSL